MHKILIVDDSATIRQLVRMALAPSGFQIVEAVDGVDGLDKLRANSDLATVLCDVNMPNMTGIEMVVQARAQGVVAPIIMLTSEGQPSLIRRARQVGANGWIVKPFKAEFLLATIEKLTTPVA